MENNSSDDEFNEFEEFHSSQVVEQNENAEKEGNIKTNYEKEKENNESLVKIEN